MPITRIASADQRSDFVVVQDEMAIAIEALPQKSETPSIPTLAGAYHLVPHGTPIGSSAAIDGALVYTPFDWPGGDIDRVAEEVLTAGSTGAVRRLGIYTDSGYRPAALLTDYGTYAATTTGIKEIVVSQALPRGRYWAAAVTQGTPTTVPTVRSISASLVVPTSLVTYAVSALFELGVTGALPATAASSLNNTTWATRYALRRTV